MSKIIKARFANGVFHPLVTLDFPEGTEVILTVAPDEDRCEGLANTSFAKDWNNEQNVIYDDWKQQYHVS